MNLALAHTTALEDEADRAFAEDILAGLSRRQKSLPSRYFYDERGSALFERITELPEYYPTRAEMVALTGHAGVLMRETPPGAVLVELGSGSSRKTELLLDAAPQLSAYVAIDVSDAALRDAAARLRERYPRLDVVPVSADFASLADLPGDLQRRPKIGFFPGSTIGNLVLGEARDLLAGFRDLLAPEGRLIIGVDLVKDEGTVVAAYNDAAGVTAAFNLNLLAHVNRRFGPVFDLSAFEHTAIWNRALSRIEMHLESRRTQTVQFRGHTFSLRRGETILTEYSHKYTVPGFADLASEAGWQVASTITDPARLFSVHDLRASQ